MLKAVIFDMDGLMIDSENISFLCYKELLNNYGYVLTKEDYLKDYPGKPLVASLNFIKEQYHIDFELDQAIEDFTLHEKHIIKEDGVPIKKGLKELLIYLKENQYKIAIASSSGRARILSMVNKEILEYFDTIVCGPEVKHGKPAPDVFLVACEKLGVRPQDALVLEDSENGILAAYQAQNKVICIPDMKYPRSEYVDKTTAVLESLDQVIDYLKISKAN